MEWGPEEWLEYQVKLQDKRHMALLRVQENSANPACETCSKNLVITNSSLHAEGDVQKLHKETLDQVYRNSEQEQNARAERKLAGCEACCANLGISRRCMSPCMDGPPVDVMEWHDDVHAIDLTGEDIVFCAQCNGMDFNIRHPMDKKTLPWRFLHAHKKAK
jgi:hypothetical protein